MPYRIDVLRGGEDALDCLIELGALDADVLPEGGLAALMPDGIAPQRIAAALGLDDLPVSAATGRDAGSVWVLGPRPVRIGRLHIVPADDVTDAHAVRLIDAAAFGTGLHPTTALCLEALQDLTGTFGPEAVLDVGTGSGVLALAALVLGVPRACGLDIDDEALRTSAENARGNGVGERFRLVAGGPEAVTGLWPLVLANVLAAPLIEMAPILVRRLAHHGHLVLSGIPTSVEEDVARAYRHLGLRSVGSQARDGWVCLVLRASW